MKRVAYLIFGNGFIASHYASHILGVHGDVRLVYRTQKNTAIPARFQVPYPHTMEELKKMLLRFQPEYIMLTQGVSFIPSNEKDIEESIKSNVLAPLKVLEAVYVLQRDVKKYRIPKKIVTFGSAAEYGDGDRGAFRESDIAHPSSLYGLSKHWLHQASEFYANLGLPSVHVRQFNAIGTQQNSYFVIPSFCRQIARMEQKLQKPILSVGDLQQKRDFIDIRDAVSAYELIFEKAKGGDVVNICSGTSYSIGDVVELLRKHTPVSFDVRVDKKLIVSKRTRNTILVGSPTLLHTLGWKQTYSFSESLSWILDYWRKEVTRELNKTYAKK